MELCYLRRKQQQKVLLFDSISDDKNDKIVKWAYFRLSVDIHHNFADCFAIQAFN